MNLYGNNEKPLNILLIEDDAFDREQIKRNLDKTGFNYQIKEVVNVTEGISLAQSNEYDIIFLDYHLPGKNGLQLLKHLKKHTVDKRVAVIIISLSDDEEVIFQCLNLGAQDFISKESLSPLNLKRTIFNAQVKAQLEADLQQSINKLQDLAERDFLTGIHNWYSFDKKLTERITQDATKGQFSLIMIDLNNFKSINDRFGQNIGDELLVMVSARLKETLPRDTFLSRLGGDEFAILLDASSYQPQLACEAIIDAFSKHLSVGEIYPKIALSIGYSTWPIDTMDKATLRQNADLALYYSKSSTHGDFYKFNNTMHDATKELNQIKRAIKSAYENDGFSLAFQPLFSASEIELEGFEVLLRMQPDDQDINPAKLIMVLEQMRLFHDLGHWIIEQSLNAHARWIKKSKRKLKISINLSPVQLNEEKLITFIIQTIEKVKVEPSLVMFELTETVFLENPARVKILLGKLSDMGCRVALDDFGTGFSSLTHLKEFPIDTVKIDKSMIPKSENDQRSIDIIKGLVLMLNSLGVEIIAEGIETEFQLDFCKQLEIDVFQGFIFAKPMDQNMVDKKYFGWKNSIIGKKF